MTFSGDGTRVVAASYDNTARRCVFSDGGFNFSPANGPCVFSGGGTGIGSDDSAGDWEDEDEEEEKEASPIGEYAAFESEVLDAAPLSRFFFHFFFFSFFVPYFLLLSSVFFCFLLLLFLLLFSSFLSSREARLPHRLPTNCNLVPTDTRLPNVDPLAHFLHFHYASVAHARADSVM